MEKHAYLIIAHEEFELLKKLIILLDDYRNDIYIHIDKKVHDFHKSDFQYLVKYSKLIFIKRINVAWGGYSQIKVELELLKCASQNKYSYYHLLSGVDLPIKSQDIIHQFFNENNGKNFIGIDARGVQSGAFNRIGFYHFFQDYLGRGLKNRNRYFICLFQIFEEISLRIQKKFSVNRIKKYSIDDFYKGPNWFSITHSLVIYLLDNEKTIKKFFCKGICADELFLQTITMHSPFKNTIINNSLRYIDWNRGSPYIFQNNDFDSICKSDKLFARKFSYKKYPEIVEKIRSFK